MIFLVQPQVKNRLVRSGKHQNDIFVMLSVGLCHVGLDRLDDRFPWSVYLTHPGFVDDCVLFFIQHAFLPLSLFPPYL